MGYFLLYMYVSDRVWLEKQKPLCLQIKGLNRFWKQILNLAYKLEDLGEWSSQKVVQVWGSCPRRVKQLTLRMSAQGSKLALKGSSGILETLQVAPARVSVCTGAELTRNPWEVSHLSTHLAANSFCRRLPPSKSHESSSRWKTNPGPSREGRYWELSLPLSEGRGGGPG